MTKETWLPVVDFEGLYEISNFGRVASLPKCNCPHRRILRLGHDTDGYPQVVLCRNGGRYTRKVHHLVGAAFIRQRPDGLVMRHLDGNPENNRPSNLKWGTPSENAADRVRHGRDRSARKTHGECGHALSGANLYTDPDGCRHCRKCRSAALERVRVKRPRKVRRSFRGENSPRAKLTRAQALEIRRRGRIGKDRQVDIAAEFGVCQRTVSLIIRGETWK